MEELVHMRPEEFEHLLQKMKERRLDQKLGSST
jgi:hypothetical protein